MIIGAEITIDLESGTKRTEVCKHEKIIFTGSR